MTQYGTGCYESYGSFGEEFAGGQFDRVVHLAAQAGVRYSIDNPAAYIDANLVGFGNMLCFIHGGKDNYFDSFSPRILS